jgi:membrane-bound lytic murein transglycosylase F
VAAIINRRKPQCSCIWRTFENSTFSRNIKIIFAFFLAAGALFSFFPGCRTEQQPEERREIVQVLPSPDVAAPVVERDLDDILQSGILRMITRYNPSNYFIYYSEEMGFEYELVYDYARKMDLSLQVVIPGEGEDLFSMLNTGKGDLIAARLTALPEREEWVDFTVPYNHVRQFVVVRKDDFIPSSLEEMGEITLSVRAHSSYAARIGQLISQGYDIKVEYVPEDMETEIILDQIAKGKLRASVVDENIGKAALHFHENLVLAMPISEQQPIAWAVRKNSRKLRKSLNAFLKKQYRVKEDRIIGSELYNILYSRYYEDPKHLRKVRRTFKEKKKSVSLSVYDDIIKREAERAGFDWRLIASIIFQESRFNPHVFNWNLGVGLMQIVPRFVPDVLPEELIIPEVNIREGCRLLKKIYSSLDYLENEDRIAFTLATYNAGVGHIGDARRLAIDSMRDPNKWKDSVVRMLPRLTQKRFYENARYGFCRGDAVVRYVNDILNRFKLFRKVILEEKQEDMGEGTFMKWLIP